MNRRAGWVLASLLTVAGAGCVRSSVVDCEDGSRCAQGYVCDPLHHLCLTPAQANACVDAQLPDGELCSADGRPGRCDATACLPACGDGMLDTGEQCDDQNFTSHDGCSSTCVAETPSWTRWESPWGARVAPAVAYDSTRGRLVVFGGLHGDLIAETWERASVPESPADWRRVFPTTSPSARQRAAIAYDATRHVIVLFGGIATAPLGDTWEYDGTTWTERTFADSPAPRAGGRMAYDPTRNRIVLFGGQNFEQALDDTWSYDGTAWTKLTLTQRPSARSGALFVYDPERQVVVLFGGDGRSSDTWELGDTWLMVPGAAQPPPRLSTTGAYLQGQGLVMFGGSGLDGILGDSWVYRNGAWGTFDAPLRPPGLRDAEAASVDDDETLVLVGGSTSDADSTRVYELDDTLVWRSQNVGSPASSVTQAALADDGTMLVLARDTKLWRFDGTAWSVVADRRTNLPKSLANRTGGAAVFDRVRGAFVHVGGIGTADDPNAIMGDTWLYDGTTFVDASQPDGPAPRLLASAAFDEARGVTVLVGGVGGPVTDAVWERDTAWHAAGAMPFPGPISKAPIAYDPVGQRVLLLAPDGRTWSYTGTWTVLPIPALVRDRGAMAWNPWRRRMTLFGGADENQQLQRDVRELVDEGWVEIDVTRGPMGTAGHAMVAVPGARGLVVAGGGSTTAELAETWILSFRSATLDELCDDGTDNDLDGRVDAADSDCTLFE